MALVKVDGILLNNEKVRQEQLKKIYWKDKQYTDFSNGSLVHKISVETKDVSPIGEGRDLLEYTFNTDTDFSKDLLKKYMSNGVNHEIYEVAQVPDGKRFRWEGDYFEKFDFNAPLKDLTKSIFTLGFNWETGRFSDLNYDTSLFKIAQVKRAEGERYVDFANESRFLDEKYLTPELKEFYGSKTAAQISLVQNSIKGRLDGFTHIGEGRIADISEAKNAQIVEDYSDKIKDPEAYLKDEIYLKDGAGFKYLAEQLKKNGGLSRYINYENKNKYVNNVVLDTTTVSINTHPSESTSLVYAENDDNTSVLDSEKETVIGKNGDIKSDSTNGDVFKTIPNKPKSLLSKTNELFNSHKISTLIGRFHTSREVSTEQNITDSAIDKTYGNSHGRNLLTKRAEKGTNTVLTNGYDNPYCRVWTYHHQYDSVSKLIRPFNGTSYNPRTSNPYSVEYPEKVNGAVGDDYLKQNTVLGENGFVNIAPKKDGCGKIPSVEIKKCMFSLENLAWKDVPRKGGIGNEEYYISDEQRGPNGGRIMWFPPYDLNFQESVSVNWNQNTFIGRGEPVFTYSNTTRSGVLSFAILVDHPSIIDNIPKNDIKDDTVLSDNDILRFFAGCDIPEGFDTKLNCDTNTPEDNKKQSDEGEQATNDDKCKVLKFKVYFPNNYSGYGVPVEKESGMRNGPSDQYWYQYLIFGKNTNMPNENESGCGYEIDYEIDGKGKGITKRNYSSGIDVALNCEEWKVGTGVYDDKNVKYEYRVDFDLRQKLKNRYKTDPSSVINTRGMIYEESNYIDSASYGLNISSSELDTVSFVDVLSAMFEANPNYFSSYFNEHFGFIAQSVDKSVVEPFKNPEIIKEIKITGMATKQDNPHSKLLAERRANCLKTLISDFTKTNAPISAITAETAELKDKTTINSKEAKLQRCVVCEIKYSAPEISLQSKSSLEPQESEVEWGWGESETGPVGIGGRGKIEASSVSAERTYTKSEEVLKSSRYETEAEYFKNIEKTDPLIFKKLTEKFKYFSPAYHSISPEGFNARLTFLQQCTRQGHTIENSDKNYGYTAGNLAFGRMPVCVLRLGDFINTKVLINGMSINYDAQGPMQWDLNPEGIGVQPMYAKVSLQITILGGQSLDGPINRLQNAVSFNYYANTGVYDNRADLVDVETKVNQLSNKDLGNNKEDNSDYVFSTLSYRHVFSPIPKIEDKK